MSQWGGFNPEAQLKLILSFVQLEFIDLMDKLCEVFTVKNAAAVTTTSQAIPAHSDTRQDTVGKAVYSRPTSAPPPLLPTNDKKREGKL